MAAWVETFLGRWFFPPQSRQFTGKRWCKIGLRSLHLFGIAGVGGGFLYQVPAQHWTPFLWLTLATGVLMVLIELWSHCIWLLQLRGLTILFKLGLLSAAAVLPAEVDPWLLFTVIMISGVISHASSRQRYYSPFYRRLITLDNWQWCSHR
ncbi:MAG: hypothetical protein V7629_04540 [Motiliproteus sp.]